MQLGESLLAIAAVVMFTVGTLQLNGMRLDGRTRMWEAEFRTTALALAQSYVEQAQTLSFDEVLTDTTARAARPVGLTPPVDFGPDAHEPTIDDYDDVDDFHAYAEDVITPRANYHVSIQATYADSSTLAPGTELSLLKWLTVAVSSPFYRDTLRVHYLCALR
ncbi:MAG: hypothetical protein HN712_03725 [Gemmatimonadetes bacterium]|jgi:hypothetical protein|nr:hypothetical protein [Gemmatimonadota bacterium]MBT6144385.1 hypothetical protein [Gemmatimonadota bacterium]MBT7859390.1 hypothetical protein [Gemmatimonadota bacterium]